jgi:hypothetical protein
MTATWQDSDNVVGEQGAAEAFAGWLASFALVVQGGSAAALAQLVHEEVAWRDFMAFPWDFHHAVGLEETVSRLIELASAWDAADFAVSREQPPVVTEGRINAFFDFTTKDRVDRGYVCLVRSAGSYVAAIIQTQAVGLRNYPERARHHRRDGKVYGVVPQRTRWADDRAGVSGHELAHDLYEHGADVILLQRSSTYVITYESYHRYFSTLFTEDMPYTPDFADQMTYALPNERWDELNKELVKLAAEGDTDLLDRLVARGFKLNWGPDGTGIIGAHMSGRDSYQIDIGASRLIADGKVHLKQGVEVAEIRGNTVIFTDDSELDVDLIVFATGYYQFWGHIKPALGSVAEKIDKTYGRAADGEYANTWRRSAQPGLWFGTGFIRIARFYSQFTALLIKAIEVGIEPLEPNE